MRFGPNDLLDLYARGVFLMADSRDDPRLLMIDPLKRGILPLEEFHIPRRLARKARTTLFRITANRAFRETIEACAEPNQNRDETWINGPIIQLYDALHRNGNAHSIEVWEDDLLVGGLYGVSLGAAFFGESMFSRKTDASKIALIHLVAALKYGGYTLLDAQFHNNHLEQFGLKEISRSEFLALLENAKSKPAEFPVFAFAGNRGEINLGSGKEALRIIGGDSSV